MKKNLAFTLVETLIVITIFGIGILTVLFGISQTLKNKEYALYQVKSAFLAREGIELVFNLRDANYAKEMPWNCIFSEVSDEKSNGIEENENPFCIGYLNPGTVLSLGIGSGNKYIQINTGTLESDFSGNFANYQLYYHSGNEANIFIYNHTGTDDEKTFFARYIYLTGLVESGNLIPSDKILKVESHVLFQKGNLTGEKIMETFIGNYEF